MGWVTSLATKMWMAHEETWGNLWPHMEFPSRDEYKQKTHHLNQCMVWSSRLPHVVIRCDGNPTFRFFHQRWTCKLHQNSLAVAYLWGVCGSVEVFRGNFPSFFPCFLFFFQGTSQMEHANLARVARWHQSPGQRYVVRGQWHAELQVRSSPGWNSVRFQWSKEVALGHSSVLQLCWGNMQLFSEMWFIHIYIYLYKYIYIYYILVGGFKHLFSHNIWDSPSHWPSYFSEG